MRMAAIYARVSSEQQREENTIASQTAALIEFAKNHDLEVPKDWVFEDEGFYEKVIKVKADVAALLIYFSDIAVISGVAWRVVKGAVFFGVHLDP